MKSKPKSAKLNQWHQLPRKSFGEWFGQYLVANMVLQAMAKNKDDFDEAPIAFKIVKIGEKDCKITYQVVYRGSKNDKRTK